MHDRIVQLAASSHTREVRGRYRGAGVLASGVGFTRRYWVTQEMGYLGAMKLRGVGGVSERAESTPKTPGKPQLGDVSRDAE